MTESSLPNAPGTGSATTAPRLLHLGCGLTAPDEWVNVDGSFNAWLAQRPRLRKMVKFLHLVPGNRVDAPWPTNLVIADLRKKLPFREGSFDAVYSSHVLEHLHRSEALAVLKEAYRVLKPGGRCRSMVPDLRDIVMEYVKRSAVPPQERGTTEGDIDPARGLVRRLIMRDEDHARRGMIYGLYRNMTDFHFHKWMYDAKSMTRLMQEAGFEQCQSRGFLETEIPHLDKVEIRERAEAAAIVEGVKGGQPK